MGVLNRKLIRDLWSMRSQAAAIAAVSACGVGFFFGSSLTFHSLGAARDDFYRQQRFADVFAGAKRVPDRMAAMVQAVPGVAEADFRVVVDVNLDVPGAGEPLRGRLISLPDQVLGRGKQGLNRVVLRRGREIDSARADEALVAEAFAESRDLDLGDTVAAIINGRRQELRIVGVVLSPEYVYGISPGEILPDPSRFGIFWVARKPLAAAFDMEGGWNDLALKLNPGANEVATMAAIDELLRPYGGLGTIPRRQQISNWYLESELSQLEKMGTVVPAIFLFVAAFLLNIVLTRTVALERGQIAVLKALGYSSLRVASHYLRLAGVLGVLGGLAGAVVGFWMATGMLVMYRDYFRFPALDLRFSSQALVLTLGVSLLAAMVGAFAAVRRVVSLPPAEAMRPATPPVYRESWLERLGWRRMLDQPSRMVVRNLLRTPWRTAFGVFGIACGAAVVVVGGAMMSGMNEIMDMQFAAAQRQDVLVSFAEPVSRGAAFELARYPGVMQVEEQRAVPVTLRYGHRSRQSAINGLSPRSSLQRVIDRHRLVVVPGEGLIVAQKLLDDLGAAPGDTLIVEVLSGRRPILELPVAAAVEEYVGTAVYMEIDALRRALNEGGTVTSAALLVDSAQLGRLYTQLKATPAVVGVGLRRAVIESFETFVTANMNKFLFFNTLFASVIAFGIVYNTARISLSERSRELASLRVLGFRRDEIAFVLIGELAGLVALAIPLGLLLGHGLSVAAAKGFESELYTIPVVVSPRGFAQAALTVIASALLSAWVVRRRLGRLDLIGVLKTRD